MVTVTAGRVGRLKSGGGGGGSQGKVPDGFKSMYNLDVHVRVSIRALELKFWITDFG